MSINKYIVRLYILTTTLTMNLNCAYPVIKETIPKSKLGYATNNIYEGFPPLMSDGRAITAAYHQDAVINDALKKQYNIKSNWEYRRFLQNNSGRIIEQEFREACNDSGYVQQYVEQPLSSFRHPVLYGSILEPAEEQMSDLKQIYLSREQLNASLIAPEIAIVDKSK